MKVLLLSDVPPCKDYAPGIVLDHLCKFLPRGSIACFYVNYPRVKARISSDLQWIPTRYRKRPRDAWPSPVPLPKRLRQLVHLGLYHYNTHSIKRITAEAVKFGQAFQADMIWCTLETQALIRLAIPVAQGLGVPLLTEVFDPPTWELRDASAHRLSQKMMLEELAKAIRYSRMCATASWPMAEQYAHDYGTSVVAFLPSLPSRSAMPPSQEMNNGQELVIGLAGGRVYAIAEWRALTAALDAVDWQIGRRTVRIRVLAKHRPPLINNRSGCIEYLGWQTQESAVKLLSEADILYCPYWFDPVFEEEARLSFPSKLTTYLAAGRPVFFHGPEYAAPAIFLKDNEAGFLCHSNETSHIIDALTALATDTSLYSRLTQNGRTAFEKYLTLSSLRQSFATFLGVEEDSFVPAE